MKFRKKPVVIDAIQWDGTNKEAIDKFVGLTLSPLVDHNKCLRGLLIPTLESPHEASIGDWIIKAVKDEH